jgi:hypothetical protein
MSLDLPFFGARERTHYRDRLIGRDIPAHPLVMILGALGARRGEARRSGSHATRCGAGRCGVGPAASMAANVRARAALSSWHTPHVAWVSSGSDVAEICWRAYVKRPVQNSSACSRQTGAGFAGMSMTAHSSQYEQYVIARR